MLIDSCRLNHIDPPGYLQCVLERIADRQIDRIEELPLWSVADELGRSGQPTDALAACRALSYSNVRAPRHSVTCSPASTTRAVNSPLARDHR